jgi:hypothetical protein
MTENVKHVEAKFADWLANQMPPNTVISDAGWWAPRILREIERLQREAAGGGEAWREEERLRLLILRQLLEGFEVEIEAEGLESPATYLEKVTLVGRFQPGSGAPEIAKRIAVILAAPARTAPRPTGTEHFSICSEHRPPQPDCRRCNPFGTTPASAEPGK